MRPTKHILMPILFFYLLTGCSGQVTKCEDNPNNICVDETKTESFLDKYRGVEVVDGNIEIQGSSLSSLSPLSDLRVVKGDLIIQGNQYLEDVSDFSKLEQVQGQLIINNNSKLASLSGFSALESVGNLTIQNSEALTNLSGLEKLSEVFSLLLLNLSSLNDLSAITSTRYSEISINGIPNLERINGFENAKKNSALNITNNSNLKEVSLFNEATQPLELASLSFGYNTTLETITITNVNEIGTLGFRGNAIQTELFTSDSLIDASVTSLIVGELNSLEELINFSNLKQVQRIELELNPLLQNLHELSSLEYLSYFRLTNNTKINSIADMTSLKSVGKLVLIDFAALDNLSMLANITVESLYIENTSSLTTLEGLQVDNLKSIFLENMEKLTNISALSSATKLERIDFIDIVPLPNLDGLPQITTLDRLRLENMQNLLSLAGLSQVENVHTLQISGNENLGTTSQLEALKSVTEISIHHNDSLESLGLDALENVHGIGIHENKSLCNSLVAPLSDMAQYIRTDITSNKDC